ncbi:MAG TPA: hypothetical protein VF832_03995 [Longimicrobiales bacterium]
MIPWTKTAATFALCLGAALACARSRPHPPAPLTPEQRLARALAVLDSGQYAPATQELQALAQGYAGLPLGRQALLSAAAAELDPRNPDRQLDRGAALMSQYLESSAEGDWSHPVAQTLYLLSLELGATVERAQQAEADAARARAQATRARADLPQLPGAPVTARMADLERDRDRLAARVHELEAGTAQLQKQLADSLQELKRVRRTLRP